MGIQIVKILFGTLFLICAAEDIKKKQVHRVLLVLMAAVAAVDFFINAEIAIWERIAGMLSGSIFLLISRVTRQQIGTADGILLMIAGGYLGIFNFMEFVMDAFFIAALGAIILLCIKKMNRKKTMPLIPFLFAGFLVFQWIGG